MSGPTSGPCVIAVFHGLMERARRVWKLGTNPVRDVDRPRTAASAGGIDVFVPDEVFALRAPRGGRAGHADIETTRKYLHFVPRPDDAARRRGVRGRSRVR